MLPPKGIDLFDASVVKKQTLMHIAVHSHLLPLLHFDSHYIFSFIFLFTGHHPEDGWQENKKKGLS